MPVFETITVTSGVTDAWSNIDVPATDVNPSNGTIISAYCVGYVATPFVFDSTKFAIKISTKDSTAAPVVSDTVGTVYLVVKR